MRSLDADTCFGYAPYCRSLVCSLCHACLPVSCRFAVASCKLQCSGRLKGGCVRFMTIISSSGLGKVLRPLSSLYDLGSGLEAEGLANIGTSSKIFCFLLKVHVANLL